MDPRNKVPWLALFAACICWTVASLTPATAQPPAAAKPGQSDQDKLQGRWQILSITVEERVIQREAPPGEWKDTFLQDVLIQGDRLGQAKATTGTFTLDDTRGPKQITIRDAEGKLTFRGIYAIEGNRLKVCVDGDGRSVRRPEEFVTQKGTPLVLIELERIEKK